MPSSVTAPSGDREQSGPGRSEAEQPRLRALRRYEVVGTEPEPNFDRITRVAASLFDVPIALINFIAEDQQWYKSAVGVESGGRDLESSFCIEAIRADGTTIIEDATETERFSDHPLVEGPPGVRFYAGAPLQTPDGYRIGTLCVLDTVSRQLSDEETGRLEDLAEMVMSELERRRTTREKLQEKDKRLQSIAENVSEGIYQSTPEGELIHVNQALVEMFGYDSAQELLEVDSEELYADPAERARVLEKTNRQDGLEGEDIEFRRADGSTFVGRVTDTVVRGEDGEVAYYGGVIADVTEQRRREQTLRRQKALLEQTQKVAGAWEVDLETGEVHRSAETRRIHEMDPGASRTLEEAFEFFAPGARPQIREAFRRCIDEEEPYDLELPLDTAEGNRRWVRTVGAPAEKKDGEIVKVAGALQDITERKEAVEALRKERNLLSRLLEISPDAIVRLDSEGTFVQADGQVQEVLGTGEEEILGRAYDDLEWKISAPDGSPIPDEELPFARVLSTDEPVRSAEISIDGEDGERRHLSVNGAPLQGGDPAPGGRPAGETTPAEGEAVFYLSDITEQKRRARALERQNDLFRRAQEIADVGAWEYDVQAGEGTMTEQVYRIYGLSPSADVTYQRTISLYHPEDQPVIREAFTLAVEEGEPYDLKLRLTPDAGEEKWVRVRGEPQRGDDQEVVRVRGTIQDVTERKRQEQKLKESRRKLRREKRRIQAITENVSDGIYRSTAEEGIVYANQAFIEMFGYRDLEDLKAAGAEALYVDPARREELIEKEAEHGRLDQEEVQYRRKDGTTFIGLLSSQQVEGEDPGSTYFDGAITDITERKRHERKLKRRRRDIEALYETTRGLLRADGQEAVCDHIHGVLQRVFDYDLVNTGFLEGDAIRSARTDRSDGTDVPPPGPRPADGHSIAARVLRDEETTVVKDTGSLGSEVDYGVLRSAAGVPIGERGVIVVGRTGKKGFDRFNLRLIEVLAGYAALVLGRLEREDELRGAKEEAEEAARLKASMLANMSHEIRTPLTSIIGFAETISEEVETLEDRPREADLSQLTQFATLIEQAGTRLLETLNSVLNLSKLEAEEIEMNARSINLAEQARQAVTELTPRAEEAGLDLKVEADKALARADEGGVQIVLQNLLSNAIKYTGEGGEVQVRVYQNGDEEAIMEVEDTGIGMEPEVAETLFEPFRQASEGLDRNYEGTGIGLAVVRRAVKQMDGTVDVDTQKGEGSRFTVRLPPGGRDEESR
ncbi:MAG: PAS domain S-box protein [Salinibacter sp.]|uniref:PAS domain S-box protein n=1 Tax=Salinibacter sp. TaxID=2065818 RepID=UPI0035D4025F